jgi:hypothetical protein
MKDSKSNGAEPGRSKAHPMNDLRLAAARKRLAESRDQEDAIEGLREIIANFLGCEEIGLFRVDSTKTNFQPFWSFGIEHGKYDLRLALGDAGLHSVMDGECHIELGSRDHSGAMAKVQAFVPIRRNGQTVAILAILRLLPHKFGFDPSDMELFQLLSHEAADPLFGSNARSKAAKGDQE